MSNNEHRTGMNLANLMVRHLHLEAFEFNKLDAAAIKEIDQNVQDNTRHEPLSCHRVPTGAHIKK